MVADQPVGVDDRGGDAREVAGRTHLLDDDGQAILAQWRRFAPFIGTVPGQVGTVTYGVRFHAHGGPEVLVEEEVAAPAPGPGQVRVRVRA